MADVLAPVLVLTGPTAVGKSALALDVAERVGAEIVSADSRQIYRGLDVGTASPTAADVQRVRHHLVDVLEPPEPYSAGRFLSWCGRAITETQSRGAPVLVIGGSTLYIHAVVRGIADLPTVSEGLDQTLQIKARTPEGRGGLYDELRRADPESAATLDPTKSQRLVRLVGLLRETGRAPSALWREQERPPLPHRLVVLDRPRSELYARIDARVDRMLTDGLIEETQRVLSHNPSARALLDATIGYREVLALLDGTIDRDEAVRLIKRNSRRYAKRQLTWFRRYEEAQWLDARTATVQDVLDAAAPWPSST
ncbi:tRNA (adenosine(37)-N6)-dimethylallyltransferase MiaA [Rubrivirga litoralis]|uniref:tRNA dimethylallyltransferase n=1 Tax=Rubrivirga litoralis TaxID=3075598 RepID=A0ABU3BTP8_9BACT|nr:tRNA (adenosine(37)-N6)-dimethylallyltransferase MiaA [Rubrivirga sp. F394]MDT0632671.1 tRNA (adenosine(37)-N6)-dimethylallyltransferase MiaA [Rubrivirga sp. F394]